MTTQTTQRVIDTVFQLTSGTCTKTLAITGGSVRWKGVSGTYLGAFDFRREAQAVDGVGPRVGPLAELL